MQSKRRAVLLFAGCVAVVACSLVVDSSDLVGKAPGTPSPDASGSIDGGGSDASDAPAAETQPEGGVVRCASDTPFTSIAIVPDVNTGASERGATLTADELNLCFDSKRDGGRGGDDVWCATRASRSDRFGPATNAGASNGTAHDFSPSLTPDGLVLYFSVESAAELDIWRATRARVTDPFGSASRVVEWGGADVEVDPFAAGGRVYLSSSRGANNTDLYVASPGGAPVLLGELRSSADEDTPVVSSDELVIYFNRNGVPGDIFVARRSNVSQPFGAPTPLAELNTTSGEWPEWLSPDGCRLYFGSNRPGSVGSMSIWLAEKSR